MGSTYKYNIDKIQVIQSPSETYNIGCWGENQTQKYGGWNESKIKNYQKFCENVIAVLHFLTNTSDFFHKNNLHNFHGQVFFFKNCFQNYIKVKR